MRRLFPHLALILFALFATTAHAQGNYEIQVYGAETIAPKTLMVELHSNFTPIGQKEYIDGVIPHQPPGARNPRAHRGHQQLVRGRLLRLHQLAERPWRPMGRATTFAPASASPRNGTGPWAVSLSTEIGYHARRLFAPDTWTWEIRPIIDKTMGRWYPRLQPSPRAAPSTAPT